MTTALPKCPERTDGPPTDTRLPSRFRLPRAAAFWALAATLLAFMAAAAAPSPLYVVYQDRWHFSATTLTAIFAVYALALLVALVTVGALSDHIGRRPVLAAALVLQVLAMLLFIAADGTGTLLTARVVQGLATGAATGAISAGLVDLNPRVAALVNSAGPGLGLGAGALGSGLLVQYAPAPTTLVFALLAAACALALVGVALIPETSARRPGALSSLRPRARVPRGSRGRFLTLVPVMVSCWAVPGLYMSLGPSMATQLLGLDSHLVGGLVVCTLMGSGAVASLALRGLAARHAIPSGQAALAAGLALTLLALRAPCAPLFFAGTALAGAGFGVAFMGAFGTLATLADAGQRAELFATAFTVNYLAFGLPSVAAGMATGPFGLATTAEAYGLTVIVLALAAVLVHLGGRGRDVAGSSDGLRP